jgi:gliding motility-associated-like protein
MRKVFAIFLCYLWLNPAIGQFSPPVLQWQKPVGGTKDDGGEDIQPTPDGGFITVGTAASNDFDGNAGPIHGMKDVFIVKYDAAREQEWRKKFGGSWDDYGTQIKPLPGGGYIVLGYTGSPNNGDVSGAHGNPFILVPFDIWLLRLDNDGDLLWQKCLGGTGIDSAGSIDITSSGGFIISGNTTSNDGDVTGNHGGGGDVWIVELNSTGNIIWQKCYGGSAKEGIGFIKTVPGGGYILTAPTQSVNGDVTPNNPADTWLVRLDATGNILWQKCYGGSFPETPGNVIPVNDGFVVGGTTGSGDWSINNHGGTDGWIFKTDLSGNLIWQHAYGGNDNDRVIEIIQDADGGFLMAGGSYLLTAGCNNNGEEDFWILKTDNAGLLQWQKNFGGTKIDYAAGIVQAPGGSLYVTGYELSDDRDVVGHHFRIVPDNPPPPNTDQWVIILAFTGQDISVKFSIKSSLAVICDGKPVEFTAYTENAGSEFSYTWYINSVEQISDNSNSFTTANIRDNDTITCKLICNIPCIGITEIWSNKIIMHTYPNGRPTGFLPPQITKCMNLYEKIGPTMNFDKYLWNTGATTQTIRIANPGNYWLEVTDISGCKGREYTTVTTKSCMHGVFVPGAFTPNNDGLNDIFKPMIDGKLVQYRFTIFDRWGQVVLQTTDPDKGWNGKRGGVDQDTHMYIWFCTYQFAGEAPKTEKGTFLLLR